MKRSTMVFKIAKLIEMIRYEDSVNGEHKNHAEEYASLLLSKLEADGMQPPSMIVVRDNELEGINAWTPEELFGE